MLVAQVAAADNVSVFKFARWRRQGVVLDEVLSQYKSVGAELNVLPYCTQFIPMEVITEPRHHSICYHPSLLPLHRGASSINWSANHIAYNVIFAFWGIVCAYWPEQRLEHSTPWP